jgi:hypothetical protein
MRESNMNSVNSISKWDSVIGYVCAVGVAVLFCGLAIGVL